MALFTTAVRDNVRGSTLTSTDPHNKKYMVTPFETNFAGVKMSRRSFLCLRVRCQRAIGRGARDSSITSGIPYVSVAHAVRDYEGR
ncbi:hypothetical protein EVAR_12205_1 [Eumeta japonica]|uniref:Uncharacterized protein n=1 Tax=Eumeta variegata TaxID=151549 RepID=A0A4C1UH44_EUMVA|nr:hypothetical protein EVAR_12205_1 [Eumeta japonica]